MRRRRAAAQLLHRPAAVAPVDVVRTLLAVQAQDLRSARLALRARGAEGELGDELVVSWLNRGTLHLVAREDHPWLLALTAPGRFRANARRLGQEGVSPDDAERAVEIVRRALAQDGPLTRAELARRIAARGIRSEGQATPHLLMLAALRGIVVIAGEQSFAPAPEPAPVDRDAALAELARRYLRGHGPAGAADLAAWSGLGLRDARAGLERIAGELEQVGELVDVAAREPAPERIPPRLLPAFDPYLLGWKDRAFAVPAEHARRVHPGGGVLRAVATDDGVVVGTWSLRKGNVTIEPFAPLAAGVAAALEADAAELAAAAAALRLT